MIGVDVLITCGSQPAKPLVLFVHAIEEQARTSRTSNSIANMEIIPNLKS
jgi:hypothetical protein